MGQKVNPIGFRLGVNCDWRSRWYASPQEMPEFLHSDIEIRGYVKKKLLFAAVSKIVIERAWNSIRVTIFTARPGIVIGRKGAEIEKMTEEISKMAQGKQIKIDIKENCYAVDAQTREVSQVPAGKPEGNSFAELANRFRRVRIANARARLDHEHTD